jgi:hypothetical protein
LTPASASFQKSEAALTMNASFFFSAAEACAAESAKAAVTANAIAFFMVILPL